jgi:hypothetical protein
VVLQVGSCLDANNSLPYKTAHYKVLPVVLSGCSIKEDVVGGTYMADEKWILNFSGKTRTEETTCYTLVRWKHNIKVDAKYMLFKAPTRGHLFYIFMNKHAQIWPNVLISYHIISFLFNMWSMHVQILAVSWIMCSFSTTTTTISYSYAQGNAVSNNSVTLLGWLFCWWSAYCLLWWFSSDYSLQWFRPRRWASCFYVASEGREI